MNFFVPIKERVRGDDEIVIGKVLEMRIASGAMENEDFEVGNEFLGFRLPVRHHAGRSDNKGGVALRGAFFDLRGEVDQGLQGFS